MIDLRLGRVLIACVVAVGAIAASARSVFGQTYTFNYTGLPYNFFSGTDTASGPLTMSITLNLTGNLSVGSHSIQVGRDDPWANTVVSWSGSDGTNSTSNALSGAFLGYANYSQFNYTVSSGGAISLTNADLEEVYEYNDIDEINLSDSWNVSTKQNVDTSYLVGGSDKTEIMGTSGYESNGTSGMGVWTAVPQKPTSVAWAQANNGVWSTSSNWAPATVPSSTIDAVFNTSSTTPYTVTLAGPSAANNLTVQGNQVTLNLGSNQLALAGSLIVSESGTQAGSLTLAGTTGSNVTAPGGIFVGTVSSTPSTVALTVQGTTVSGNISNYGSLRLLQNPTITGNVTNIGAVYTGTASAGDSTIAGGNVVTVNGNYVHSSTATLTMQASNSAQDAMNISGTATLAGTLAIYHDSTFAPTPGVPIPIMHYASATGAFTHIQSTLTANKSYLGLGYKSGEVDLKATPTLTTLATLSNQVYGAYSGLPNFNYLTNNAALIGGQAFYSGFRAVAYESPGSSNPQIVIAFRGTDLVQGSITAVKNAAADVSFVGSQPTSDLQTDISYATAFVQAIESEYPNAFITLTGHSLGGAIAQLEGQASGLSAIAFNAPGGEQLYNSLSTQLQVGSSNWLPSTGVNVNYRIFGDQVSLLGTPVGSTITLPAPTSVTFVPISDPTKEAIANLSAYATVHSADTIVAQINSQPVSETGELNDATAIQNASILSPNQTTGATALQILLSVVAGAGYLIDPVGGSEFTLSGSSSSPHIASVDFPALPGVYSYDLREEIAGVWTGDLNVTPNDSYALGTNVTSIEFSPLDASGNPLTLNDAFLFDATFDATGTYSGTLTEVPEPSTLGLFVAWATLLVLPKRRLHSGGVVS